MTGTLTEAKRKKFALTYQRFAKMRTEVIEQSLSIENSLTIVLLHFLVGEDYSRHELLRSLIFESDTCSFMQKRKMLSLVFEMYGKKITCGPEGKAPVIQPHKRTQPDQQKRDQNISVSGKHPIPYPGRSD